MISFRDYHTIQILSSYAQQTRPLDALIRGYLKEHRSIGSKDRNQIYKNIYYIIKNLSFIDYHLHSPITWEKRLEWVHNRSNLFHNYPEHILYSCPKWLYDCLAQQLTKETLVQYLKTSLTEAPLTIRSNTEKISRDDLAQILKEKYPLSICEISKTGIKFSKREPVTSDELYKKGFFEIQDEASQIACSLISVKPGDHILDYCAGAGGKSLAIAPLMKKKGLIYVHDIRAHSIKEARKRFDRASIHQVQFFDRQNPLPSSLKRKCDCVIVDVPCTGTGTFRRNPDLKWKLTEKNLNDLVQQQRQIFEEALTYLKPQGMIIYLTCSVLKQENGDQKDYFLKMYPNLKVLDELILYPKENGHDGFYGVKLYLDDKN